MGEDVHHGLQRGGFDWWSIHHWLLLQADPGHRWHPWWLKCYSGWKDREDHRLDSNEYLASFWYQEIRWGTWWNKQTSCRYLLQRRRFSCRLWTFGDMYRQDSKVPLHLHFRLPLTGIHDSLRTLRGSPALDLLREQWIDQRLLQWRPEYAKRRGRHKTRR